ncbi:MAG: sulfotransferase [Verrucomicrobiales bacterium]|nr:sulfotransferase [Verrucomicrobiales bacterium]
MAARWTIERAMEEKPPHFHPLAGCDLENFRAHFENHDGFTERTESQRKKSRLAVLARHPFTLMERLLFSKKVANYELPHPPIFIIGHWRSGTTHLHNLMSSAPQFSTIDFGQTAMPHNLLNPTRFIGRAAMSTAVPKDRGMDRVKMGMKEPQEEEMALGNLNPICYYNVFYYPQEIKEQFEKSIFLEGLTPEEIANFEEVYIRLLRKLSIAGKGKPLLLKNPASTARVELLDRLFEGSRFIHIVRNPFEVFASMLHHYPRLFNAFAWQRFDNIDLEEMVFYKYGRLMKGFLEQKEKVGDRMLETSYEKIVADPVGEIGRFYEALGLDGKEEALAEISSYAEAGKGYKRNQYQLSRAQVDRIRSDWGFALEEWGYDVPESIEVI